MTKLAPPPKHISPPPDPNEYDEDASRMSIWDHLIELRKRLVRSSAALVLGTIIGFLLAGLALDYLRQPYCQLVNEPNDCRLVTLGPTGNIIVYFRVSLMLGGIFAMPIITYQLLMFIFPGLTRRERRYVLLSLPAITGLFMVGVLFTWFVLMPPALGFLQGFERDIFKPEWTGDLYLSFVTSLLFWMGVAFQTPLVFFVLALLGQVTERLLIRHWRLAVVGASIAAAFITPTIDPVNMTLVMIPLLVLYAISIFLVMFARRIAGLS